MSAVGGRPEFLAGISYRLVNDPTAGEVSIVTSLLLIKFYDNKIDLLWSGIASVYQCCKVSHKIKIYNFKDGKKYKYSITVLIMCIALLINIFLLGLFL
jgi:hypothetical protein